MFNELCTLNNEQAKLLNIKITAADLRIPYLEKRTFQLVTFFLTSTITMIHISTPTSFAPKAKWSVDLKSSHTSKFVLNWRLHNEACTNLLFNPLTPMSDQDRISPYNINTISTR